MTNVDGLKEDSKCLDLKCGKSQDEESSENITDLESVVEFSNSEERYGKSQTKLDPSARFRLDQQKLNMLALTTTIMRTQANKGSDEMEKKSSMQMGPGNR